jgi:membrane protein DedA with SNARE-associated domain
MFDGFSLAQADLAVIGLAFVAQALKEWGIPSPGVTQSSLMYAGCQLVAGGFLTGSLIIAAIFAGSLCGSSAIYWTARLLGRRFISRFGKYLNLTSAKLEQFRLKIGGKATLAVMLGRFVPTMMVPLSVSAGIMRIPMLKYSAGIALAVLMWASIFVSIGAFSGQAIGEVRMLDLQKILPALLGALLGAFMLRFAFLYFWRRRAIKQPATQTPADPLL